MTTPNWSIGQILVGGAQTAALVGQLVLIKSLIGVLSSAEFGIYALVLAVSSWVVMLFFGPLAQSAMRFYHEAWESGRLCSFYKSVAALSGTVALCGFGIVALSQMLPVHGWSGLSQKTPTVISYGIAIGVASGLAAACVNIVTASRHRGLTVLLLLLGPWVQVFAVVAAKNMWAAELTDYLRAILGSHLVILVLGIVVLATLYNSDSKKASKIARRTTVSFIWEMLSYSSPFMLWALPMYVVLYADRWALAYYADPETLAAYTIMILITINVLTAITTIIDRAVTPDVFSIVGSGEVEGRVRKGHRVILRWNIAFAIMCLPAIGVYYLWPDALISLVSSREYIGYDKYLWILLLSGVAFALAQMQAIHGMVGKYVKAYVAVKFAAGIVMAGSVTVAGMKYGVAGVAYSVLLSHIVHLALMLVANHRRLRGKHATAHNP